MMRIMAMTRIMVPAKMSEETRFILTSNASENSSGDDTRAISG
jgi:hypothetical protein